MLPRLKMIPPFFCANLARILWKKSIFWVKARKTLDWPEKNKRIFNKNANIFNHQLFWKKIGKHKVALQLPLKKVQFFKFAKLCFNNNNDFAQNKGLFYVFTPQKKLFSPLEISKLTCLALIFIWKGLILQYKPPNCSPKFLSAVVQIMGNCEKGNWLNCEIQNLWTVFTCAKFQQSMFWAKKSFPPKKMIVLFFGCLTIGVENCVLTVLIICFRQTKTKKRHFAPCCVKI